MKLEINYSSFKKDGVTTAGRDCGTITVNLPGGPVEARAVRWNETQICVAGFIGRYRSSQKAWNACVDIFANGELFVHFGRDDRSGRFNKRNMISWEPATFTVQSRAEFWNAA